MDDELMEPDTEDDLVSFGSSQYTDPKFVQTVPIGVTALKFLNSKKIKSRLRKQNVCRKHNNGLFYRFALDEAQDDILINETYVGNVE